MIRITFLAGASAAAFAALTAVPAAAECVQSGTPVKCSGFEGDGFSSTANDLQINILADAQV